MLCGSTHSLAHADRFTHTRVDSLTQVSVKKLRYARLRNVLDSSTLVALMEGVVRSPAKTVMLQVLPALVDGGVDPVEQEVVEDEFDLSDIMGTAVDVEVQSTEQLLRQAEVELQAAAAQAKEAAAAVKAAAAEEAAAKAKAKKKKDKAKAKKKAAKVRACVGRMCVVTSRTPSTRLQG